ncbi:cathepsin O-like protein [Sarcoptes scabiei]|uniref:Cathepsin O-like protein n=1 Tax=Sarcoptes scabiei TaxID=52283 RepID=A0A132ACB0_SARSC|nr:cathepsin O-like protein [Sarcoptes scabiei]
MFFLHFLIIKHSTDLIQIKFESFINEFRKPYLNDPIEYLRRIRNFEKSLMRIQYLNSFRLHNESAYFGLTKYSDLSPEEFRQLSNLNFLLIIKIFMANLVLKNNRKSSTNKRFKKRRHIISGTELENANIPPKFDWRDKNKVNPVRNQGKCGACWAFSIAATVESMVAIKTEKLYSFSAQQLIDCVDQNRGCQGGDTCSTLEWITKNNITIETSDDYPERDYADECHSNAKKPGIGNESKMIELIYNHGPLIAAVDASTWQNYLGGIVQYHCFSDRNHAVQITGYDLTGPIPFYKVRNTWDINFGIDGYIHIAIGNNLCGIAEEVSALNTQDIPSSFYN